MSKYDDAKNFADVLKKVKFDKLMIGKFELKAKKGVESSIQYNQAGLDLLKNTHEYTFQIQRGSLELSLQLYENINNHYRLYCYTSFNGAKGMTFSINLTTEKESDSIIYLTQKIKFSEGHGGNKDLAKAHRRQKQVVLCELLDKLDLDITENNDLILGIFDPVKKQFANTTPEQFLNDFILVSILKGHFQGNKGYQLEILPNYNKQDVSVSDNSIKQVPIKVVKNKSKRTVPLSMRYKILKKDNFTCVACGRNVDDGVKLHIDHKKPFSLGGLTEISNLQTLCSECNIGKSNKYID